MPSDRPSAIVSHRLAKDATLAILWTGAVVVLLAIVYLLQWLGAQ